MVLSACIFGYGSVGKNLVDKFSKIDGYGKDIRIHIVVVKDLKNISEAILNSIDQWKIAGYSPDDLDLGISIGDDAVWLAEDGYLGHDTIIDCSDREDFSEEIKTQLELNPRCLVISCPSLGDVDLVIKNLKDLIDHRRLIYGKTT